MRSLVSRKHAVYLPLLVLFLGTLIGGQLNRVDARGRIIDDTTDLPIPDVTVSLGSRATVTDADGRYQLDNLPRGSRLDTNHRYYGRHPVSPEQTELRIVPLTVTLHVHDAYTSKGVDTPEARQPDDTQIGKGTVSGEMVIGPYPPTGSQILICAKNYQPQRLVPRGPEMTVELTPSAGTDCPPLKVPPSPSPSPSALPSGSVAPSAAPSSPPTGTP
jgi:hypothetical protein